LTLVLPLLPVIGITLALRACGMAAAKAASARAVWATAIRASAR
jgi:hypothetical protein